MCIVYCVITVIRCIDKVDVPTTSCPIVDKIFTKKK